MFVFGGLRSKINSVGAELKKGRACGECGRGDGRNGTVATAGTSQTEITIGAGCGDYVVTLAAAERR